MTYFPILTLTLRQVGTRLAVASRRWDGEWRDPWGGQFDHATLRAMDEAALRGIDSIEIPGRGTLEVFLCARIRGALGPSGA